MPLYCSNNAEFPLMSDEAPLGALDGVRIVDLTQMLAGPFCTMLLADQGAEIVKVEPLDGDDTRIMGPYHDDDRLRAFGGYFASINRNKKSIAIDLKKPEGRDLVLRLCEGADAIVENSRAGVMDRLGLGYDALHERFPKLVYATIRGFGDRHTGKSPYTDWPAYDVVSQAFGGVMAITGPDKDTPMKVGPGIGDLMPATMSRRRHRLGDPARSQDRQGPARRRRHGRCHPVDVRAHRAPALLHRRRAGAGGQPPSPALPVRHVPGQGWPRHPRRADRCALADPLPPDRQARDGQRPPVRHGPGPARQPGRDHRGGVGLHAPAHQAGIAETSRRPGAVRAGQRRARRLRRSALRRARHAGVGAPSRPRPRHEDRGRRHQDDRDARPRAPSRALAGRAHRRVSEIHRLQRGGHRPPARRPRS